MLSQKCMAWTLAVLAIYFGFFGIKGGLVICGTIGSFLFGERRSVPKCFENMIMYMLLLTTQANSLAPEECSRTLARQARFIVSKNLSPLYTVKQIEMPNNCPFSPANDRYVAQDSLKRKLGSKWMCSVCGRSFLKENDLESHIDEMHAVASNPGCLASHCDILRCDAFFDEKSDNWKCEEEVLREKREKCMSLMRDECIPEYLDMKQKLQFEAMLQASVCSYLTCDNYYTIPQERHPDANYYYVTYAMVFLVLCVFLLVYFKVASYDLERSPSMEDILAEAHSHQHTLDRVIPPVDQSMELRQRSRLNQSWHEGGYTDI